jgi:hypothetical protein
MSDNGSNGNGHSDDKEKPLSESFMDFVAKKKAATHCETCKQPLPTNGHTSYREDPSPVEETIEESTSLGVAASKVRDAWKFLFDHTPAPVKWMFKSVSWILVGSVVAGAFIGASYFLVRYLVWYLIIALGKWLIGKIGRGLPHMVGGAVGLAVKGTPAEADVNYWMTGALAIAGAVVLYHVGKISVRIMNEWKESRE